MPIDIDKLLRFSIPEVRQVLDPKDIALYALSIGLGRDPLDEEQLRFVDPLKGPAVMPSMVLVMAHPGFWLAHPDSGVDPKAVLHAAQAFEIFGQIPQSGHVSSRTRIVDIVDKGEGKAALIDTETELRDEFDRLFARLDRTTFIRGGGGFGGRQGKIGVRQASPDRPADIVVDIETGAEQALLYRLSGDLNPIHSDPTVAAEAGFGRPILHGLCTMGIVTHALVKSLADYRGERLEAMQLRFSGPVFPGELIRTEIWGGGSFRATVPGRGVAVVEGGRARIGKLNSDERL
ncbi:MaoC family dehydratase [Sinorhizobium medicae]|uniref:MaoC family dehydratase n=1 Tax=Sinorhizobium medicae TaxID=110321 RepID=UPI000FD70DAE|nr:MaoC family dehydratase [Sinorhizobium medicae]RVO73515.1 MaoC family dehydratase [Sinorhizobium medicae]